MCKKDRQSGHGSGPVTIGSVMVQGRWRYSYLEQQEPPGLDWPGEEFKFVVTLTLADRKRLVNLKKGDWTTLTADRFREMPVYLNEIDYNDGTTKVALTFTRTLPPSINWNSETA